MKFVILTILLITCLLRLATDLLFGEEWVIKFLRGSIQGDSYVFSRNSFKTVISSFFFFISVIIAFISAVIVRSDIKKYLFVPVLTKKEVGVLSAFFILAALPILTLAISPAPALSINEDFKIPLFYITVFLSVPGTFIIAGVWYYKICRENKKLAKNHKIEYNDSISKKRR